MHIDHEGIKQFAAARVDLPAERAKTYRDQVRALRERLASKISEDPEIGLIKMLHSGSVAKGTALRTVNDLDVAVYVTAAKAPNSTPDLLGWLRERLVQANSNMNSEQFVLQEHCVTVSFKGSGLDVDVVPVLYEGEDDDMGYLIRKGSGERVRTSIPLHLDFIRRRKQLHGPGFAQVIPLTKWWKRVELEADASFRLKSFMQEMLWARLVDSGVSLDDYTVSLEDYFKSLVRSGLDEQIWFPDYGTSEPDGLKSPIRMLDPVNADNNVAARYTLADKERVLEAAHRCLDALAEARFATTKARAVKCWQTVLGPAFSG